MADLAITNAHLVDGSGSPARMVDIAIDGGVTWFTWWASHDIDRKFAVDPLEYSLGLIGCDRRAKPQAETFRRIAASYRGKRRDPRAMPTPPPPPAEPTMESTWDWMLGYQAGRISP